MKSKNSLVKILKIFVTGLWITKSKTFDEDKTKLIIFATKWRLMNVHQLSIRYNYIIIKQHSEVRYLGWVTDETMSDEPFALKVIDEMNQKLKFLYTKNRYLTKELCRMLRNALIKLHFNYPCQTWHSNLYEKYKKKIQIMQKKCIVLP